MYDATSNHLWQLRFEEHEPFSLRDMKPAWLPASTAQDCSIRKSNDFWCIALHAKQFWKAIIHECKQSFDALGAELQVVITCLASNSTRQGLIRCSCNVKQSFTFRVLTRIFFLLVSWRFGWHSRGWSGNKTNHQLVAPPQSESIFLLY